jgi:type IV pilus assembly protein PilN
VIRINLLSQKRDTRGSQQASQAWLLAILGVVVLEVVGLFLFHQSKLEELAQQEAENKRIDGQIAEIKKLVANHQEVKAALEVLRAREASIAELQAARSGPTAVLLELAQVLTPSKGPTANPDTLAQLRKDNPLAVYNAGWDSRRVWLTSYTENQRSVKIEGLARDGNDVYELAQRLKLSVYFYDVELLPGKKEIAAKTKLELVSFALQLKVRY